VVGAEAGLSTVAIGSVRLFALGGDLPPGTRDVFVCIRAEDVIVLTSDPGHSSPRNRLPSTVLAVERDGQLMRVDLDAGFPLSVSLTKQACEELELRVGGRVFALVKAPHVHLIPRARLNRPRRRLRQEPWPRGRRSPLCEDRPA